MPYVQRDATGRVVALYHDAPSDGVEFLPVAHPDVLLFLEANGDHLSEEDRRRLFVTLDASMIRVIEDLIDLLLQKHVIVFTDLPPEAREKILARKGARERLIGSAGLISEADATL